MEETQSLTAVLLLTSVLNSVWKYFWKIILEVFVWIWDSAQCIPYHGLHLLLATISALRAASLEDLSLRLIYCFVFSPCSHQKFLAKNCLYLLFYSKAGFNTHLLPLQSFLDLGTRFIFLQSVLSSCIWMMFPCFSLYTHF